jgi:hypothetical protein
MDAMERGRRSDDGVDALHQEVAALRVRLGEVEAALGLPTRPGQPAPPALPTVARRIAALERRTGSVPGLAPLPGCDSPAAPEVAPPATPRSWRQAGRDLGQALVAAGFVIALGAWLLRPPAVSGGHTGRSVPTSSPPPTAVVLAARPVASARPSAPAVLGGKAGRTTRGPGEGCDHEPDPWTLMSEPPCLTDGTAPCAATGGGATPTAAPTTTTLPGGDCPLITAAPCLGQWTSPETLDSYRGTGPADEYAVR